MKALTVHQPWATLIAIGAKRLETRSWSTSYRGPLAIHAAKSRPDYMMLGDYLVEPVYEDVRHVEDCYCDQGEIDVPCARRSIASWALTENEHVAHPLPLGAVVARTRLVDVVLIVAEQPPLDREPWEVVMSEPWPIYTYWPGYGSARSYEFASDAPFGDFSSGRYAWLLADVEPLPEPIPAKGRFGLWEWDQSAMEATR